MPQTEVFFFEDDAGHVLFLEWLAALPETVQDKCATRIQRLESLGYDIRRPEADFLRDGIYELRLSLQKVNYRILYFFHGASIVVVSHGITKKAEVPPKEIDLAVRRRFQVAAHPERHLHKEKYVQEN